MCWLYLLRNKYSRLHADFDDWHLAHVSHMLLERTYGLSANLHFTYAAAQIDRRVVDLWQRRKSIAGLLTYVLCDNLALHLPYTNRL